MAIERTRFPVEGGRTCAAAVAFPAGAAGPGPGVIVVHDIYGFQPDTERHLRRFAEAGFVALAPDLYEGSPRCVIETLLSVKRERGGALDVLAAARRHLARLPQVDERRIGITGFCMGGGFALLAAADDAFAVAAPFYGMVPRSAERLRGICPVLAQYGERDASFRGYAARLRRHLDELGVPHEVIEHPGVGHAFMNDHRFAVFRWSRHLPIHAAYDADTEAVAWQRLVAFFEEHMAPGSDGSRTS